MLKETLEAYALMNEIDMRYRTVYCAVGSFAAGFPLGYVERVVVKMVLGRTL